VQSLIRDETQRGVLYQMDDAIQRLNQTNADEIARRSLIGCYHNLVRIWSET
jgi:PKHD-type hydroxylase